MRAMTECKFSQVTLQVGVANAVVRSVYRTLQLTEKKFSTLLVPSESSVTY
jgi:hypothetical protein